MTALVPYHYLSLGMASGDIIEFRGNGWLGRSIRYFTGYPWNHSALVIRLDNSGLKDRRWILEAESEGIRFRLLSNDIANYDGVMCWLKLRDDYNSLRAGIEQWAMCKIGVKYDYGNLVSQIFGRVSLDARKFFCSEFVHAAYASVGLLPSDIPALQPGEFSKWGLHHRAIVFH